MTPPEALWTTLWTTPVDNPPDLGKTEIPPSKDSPPMPPLSKKNLSLVARDDFGHPLQRVQDQDRLIAALIDAVDGLKAQVDDLASRLAARGLI